MTPEAKKQLEEMAENHKKNFNAAYDWLAYESWMLGAQAAWDLAVKQLVTVIKFPEHKCSLTLEHNAHRDYYEKTKDVLDRLLSDKDITPSEYSEMLAADSIWSLQWYPDTPVGFCIVYDATLEGVLRKAMQ